ncbi:MAG: hypothetical protein ABL927_01305 [Bdellovibrionales bacterium]
MDQNSESSTSSQNKPKRKYYLASAIIGSCLVGIPFLFQNFSVPNLQVPSGTAQNSSPNQEQLPANFPFAYEPLQADYVAYTSCAGVNNMPISEPGLFTFRVGSLNASSDFIPSGGLRFSQNFWNEVYHQSVTDETIAYSFSNSPNYLNLEASLYSSFTPKKMTAFHEFSSFSQNLILNMRNSGVPGNTIPLLHPQIQIDQDFSFYTEQNLQPIRNFVTSRYLGLIYNFKNSSTAIPFTPKRGFKFAFSGKSVSNIIEYDFTSASPVALSSIWLCNSYPIVERKDLYGKFKDRRTKKIVEKRLDTFCKGPGKPGDGALAGWTIVPSPKSQSYCAVPPSGARCYSSSPALSATTNLLKHPAIQYVSVCTRQ